MSLLTSDKIIEMFKYSAEQTDHMVSTYSRLIEEYKPALTEGDIDFQVSEEVSNPDKFLEETLEKLEKKLRMNRSDFIYLPNWREILLSLENPNDSHYDDNRLSLRFGIRTSFENQALRRGLLNELFIPVAIHGILVSSDDKIVVGLRGGEVKAGKLLVVPAGMVKYKPTYSKNPLFDTFYDELYSEAGLSASDIESPSLIGLQYDGEISKGNVYIFKARSSRTFDEIVESWRHAEDSWEHEKLIPVGKTPEEIYGFIKNPPYPILKGCSNDLIAYIHSQK